LGGVNQTIAQNSRGTDAERKRRIDSVEAVLKLAHEDTNKVNILNALAEEYQITDNELAIAYGKKALSLGQELNFINGIQRAYEHMGMANYNVGQYEKSVDYIKKQLELLEPHQKNELAGVYQSFGNSTSGMGNYLDALDYYIKAEKLYEELHDTTGMTGAHHNIGVIYFSRNQYDEALKYYFKVLEIVEGTRYEKEMDDTYNNIASVYSEMDEYKLAIEYYTQSIQMYEGHNDEWGSAYSLEGIGEVYAELGEFAKAVEYLTRALEITQKFDDNYLMIYCYNALGTVHSKQGNLSTALAFQMRALSRAEELNLPECLQLVHEEIASTYERMKDHKKSLFHYKRSTAIGDSLLNVENARQVNELATRYDTEKNISKPSEVLKYLHVGLLTSLHESHEDGYTKDGMDIAFCKLNYKTLELQFAGAHNPFYLIRDNELIETKGDKLIIGDQRFGDDYTNHTIQLRKGDCFYIFSDGFADQLGGAKRKKFYYKRFMDLLLEIHQNSMQSQKEHLDKVILEWIGDGEQIDDILVIGARV